MASRPAFLALCLVAVALAGCADGGGKAATDEVADPVDQLDLRATATTGVLRGVVVDEAIRPLANASIEVTGTATRNATTGPDGVFGFDQLEPGTYFVKATRLGYLPVQQSAEVQAGVDDPPALKVVLRRDVAFQAFVEVQQYEGFIECTSSILVLCGIPNVVLEQNVTNDRFAWDQPFSDNASHIQAEMVWQSTQALSPALYFEMEALNEGCEAEDDDASSFLNNTQGNSPIYATINATQVQTWSIGSSCPVWVSVFSMGPVCTPPVPEGGPLGGFSHCPGVTVQQRFTMYFHSFHGHLPPPGWRFTVDGDPPPPPQ